VAAWRCSARGMVSQQRALANLLKKRSSSLYYHDACRFSTKLPLSHQCGNLTFPQLRVRDSSNLLGAITSTEGTVMAEIELNVNDKVCNVNDKAWRGF
jgi:hypothetical protein